MTNVEQFWVWFIIVGAALTMLALPVMSWRGDQAERRRSEQAKFEREWRAQWERAAPMAPRPQVTGVDDLLDLDPREFENAIAELLRLSGYSDVERIGGAGDLGVDITCNDGDGSLVAVQCKRYALTRPIRSSNIQQFFGMVVHLGADRGLYVTTSHYTQAAQDLADARDIELVDGVELVRRIAAIQERRQHEKATVSRSDTPSPRRPNLHQQLVAHATRVEERERLERQLRDDPVALAWEMRRLRGEYVGQIPTHDTDLEGFHRRLERLFPDDPERVQWELQRYPHRPGYQPQIASMSPEQQAQIERLYEYERKLYGVSNPPND